jgi:uncharacterized protein YciI
MDQELDMTHFVLLYDYVEEVVEKRQPYRDEHLGLLTTLHAEGKLAMAGAWNDPVDGAALVFVGDNDSAVRDFVQRDPYVVNGLVTGWRIREWNVVVGGGVEG